MKAAVRRVLMLSAMLSPQALFALGLGDIKLNSALNQPFDAEIELVAATPDDLSTLRATLASGDTLRALRTGSADISLRLCLPGGAQRQP